MYLITGMLGKLVVVYWHVITQGNEKDGSVGSNAAHPILQRSRARVRHVQTRRVAVFLFLLKTRGPDLSRF